jgi:hypothetical protein
MTMQATSASRLIVDALIVPVEIIPNLQTVISDEKPQ